MIVDPKATTRLAAAIERLCDLMEGEGRSRGTPADQDPDRDCIQDRPRRQKRWKGNWQQDPDGPPSAKQRKMLKDIGQWRSGITYREAWHVIKDWYDERDGDQDE